MTTTTTRAGFSLMELMIAIMILGIGLVMVATVFPVGLDMSRETIQMDISQAVSDAALATLKIKVPVYREMDQSGDFVARVLVPDVLETDAGAVIGPEDDELLNGLLNPGSDLNIPQIFQLWGPGWPSLNPMDIPEFFRSVKVFTERTGWAGEMNHWDHASVLPAQNLPPNYRDLIPSAIAWTDILTTMIAPAFFVAPPGALRANLPRIHFVDQVYPPVPVTYEDNDGNVQQRPPGQVIEDLASRRYAWTAIHHRISSEQVDDVLKRANRNMLTTIVITHRADLNELYARQEDLDPDDPDIYDVDFDLSDATHRLELLQPAPDADGATDMLFPRPWLVMLNRVNPATGEIGCTGEVARLLPADSFFIVAATKGLFFVAGTHHKVRASIWDESNLRAADPDDEDYWARLEIARGTEPMVNDLAVWVFPPAINPGYPRDDPGVFKNRSPVVGVALREVEVSQ